MLAATLLGLAANFSNGQGLDADRDGLPDRFEQALLTKFEPDFHVSQSDCDIAPAEFLPTSHQPHAVSRNGTVYGQVFPVSRPNVNGAFIEVHYYHLWTRDCGRMSHPFDSESVSVLLRADRLQHSAKAWTAEYWYAAAHEDTLCDRSNGARAAAINAVDRGPNVWISKDKHASFLHKDLCTRGCGKDECEGTKLLKIAKLINIGEAGAPLNGADWSAFKGWLLAEKMAPDFKESLIARMPAGDRADLMPARANVRGMHNTIKTADNTFTALSSATSHTGNALAAGASGAGVGIESATMATRQVERSLGIAVSSAVKSMKSAGRWLYWRRDREH